MNRPWVSPEEVRDYTDSNKVKGRTDAQLKIDITGAESYVIFYTHNKFDQDPYGDAIPEEVRMAVILLAEAYALKHIAQVSGNVASETFDDYAYTVDSGVDLIDNLNIGPLLKPYVIEDKGRVVMKMRRL